MSTENKKYKEDNKTIKESTRRELSNKVVTIGSKFLTNTEAEILNEVLINNKSFAEIGENRLLTASRVKQIFQKAVLRLSNYFNTIEEKMNYYRKLEQNYSLIESRLSEYEKPEQELSKIKNIIDSLPTETQIILKTRITNTEFSTRVKNVCQRGNIYGTKIETVADLVRLNPQELLKLLNCGKKTIIEIEDFLKRHNLTWAMLD